MRFLLALLLFSLAPMSVAGPFAAPGDVQLRHDLELLNDAGITNVPLTAWPVSLPDVHAALATRPRDMAPAVADAYQRVKTSLGYELEVGITEFEFGLAGAVEPRFIRSFEDTPRDAGEFNAALSWMGERFAIQLSGTAVADPFDGDDARPDGSFVGVVLGNWMLTAGWQERWWGPGRDGSLILSNNARPSPGIALQRNISKAPRARWLRWVGPWTLTTFMNQLDDERVVDDAWLFGIRLGFRPPRTGLEFGFSRTAQWCGDERPCDLGVFGDLLVGNDNRGVNVDPDDEPGNQLGGFDIRWRLPKSIPAALYVQWIGEDGRGGGEGVGSWMRQVGLETWGAVGELSHRTHIEVSDSMCREGGLGFSDEKPNCAYEHSIYQTGYRYEGRAIAHGTDGDSLSYSIGSTLVQSAGHTWNISLRFMEINRAGPASSRHTLSATPQDLWDVQVSHSRDTRSGLWRMGIGYLRAEDLGLNETESDVSAFIQWSSR